MVVFATKQQSPSCSYKYNIFIMTIITLRNMPSHMHASTHTHMNTHACMHTHIHEHTHMRECTHTHTHTQTHMVKPTKTLQGSWFFLNFSYCTSLLSDTGRGPFAKRLKSNENLRVHYRLHIYPLCGIFFYFPWHRHQIEGTTGCLCLFRKTQANVG